MPASTPLQALRDVAAGDSTLMAILTGGAYTDATLGSAPINEADLPGAYETTASGVVRLKGPVALFTDSGDVGFGPAGIGKDQTIRVGLYAPIPQGFDELDAAADRLHALLHDKEIALTGGSVVHVSYVDKLFSHSTDPSVETGWGGKEGASYNALRFTAVTSRPR